MTVSKSIISIQEEDEFKDWYLLSMDSLKEVWDNDSDEEIWKKYL